MSPEQKAKLNPREKIANPQGKLEKANAKVTSPYLPTAVVSVYAIGSLAAFLFFPGMPFIG